MTWQPYLLSFKLAAVTTVLLIMGGLPLAWWLVFGKSKMRLPVHILSILPLVLPPTVLGFYLLLFLGPNGVGGKLAHVFELETFAFSFSGLVFGSIIYSLPFFLQPVVAAFLAIGSKPFEIAATLKARPLDQFFTIALPLAREGVVAGSLLAFVHTIGEFGVVLMIGGSIPGQTKVVSIAIYEHVESLEYEAAHLLSAGLVIFSSAIVLLLIRSKWMGVRR